MSTAIFSHLLALIELDPRSHQQMQILSRAKSTGPSIGCGSSRRPCFNVCFQRMKRKNMELYSFLYKWPISSWSVLIADGQWNAQLIYFVGIILLVRQDLISINCTLGLSSSSLSFFLQSDSLYSTESLCMNSSNLVVRRR